MNQLVVLVCFVAAASAAPHLVVPASTAFVQEHVAIPVAAAPAVAQVHVLAARDPIVVPQPPHVVETESIGTVLTKNVHYAPKPVVTGYTSTIIKPDLGSVATPHAAVSQQTVAAAVRAVDTVVPHITHVQPAVAVEHVAVHAPIQAPVALRTHVVQAAPVVHAVPALTAVNTHHVLAASPVVAAKTVVAPAPAIIAPVPALAAGHVVGNAAWVQPAQAVVHTW